MIKCKKLSVILLMILLIQNIVFGVTIVDSSTSQGTLPPANQGGEFAPSYGQIFLIALITLFSGILLLIFFWAIWKLYKKISEDRKALDDIEFYKFKNDYKQCIINRDTRFVYRTWYTFFLFKKRAIVYAMTEYGKKSIGLYEGDAIKKEGRGYFILALYQKYSFFKRESDVLIIPYDLKHIIKKHEDFNITIDCEGIDETMSSEYFSIPLILNPSGDKEHRFIDFTNDILNNYLKTYVYRDVIKNNIAEFRQNIRDATEMNSNIQYDRKAGSDLNNK